jgi:N-acetylglucosamine-6-phosphate deacetylase
MLPSLLVIGDIVLPDRVLSHAAVAIADGRIAAVGTLGELLPKAPTSTPRIDHDGYIAPGYIDMHVHGGGGADFMDGTEEAFLTALAAHLRHGTTSIVPTTTTARYDQTLAMLELCRKTRDKVSAGPQSLPQVLGAHLYGPYFRLEARGCHSAAPLENRNWADALALAGHSDEIRTATIAPELPGMEQIARAYAERGVRLNVGHSLATFEQVLAAIDWGVRHVDHLYCAMSDKTKLRAEQPYPMQGGVQEATMFFDELTTEVIADGRHLSADLLLLAHKLKGADRLALVTDCSRALDMPDGRYQFGPLDGGEPFLHRDGVGMMIDGKGLASSVRGMDHMVRTFHSMTGLPLYEVIRMATLTPARILGCDDDLGSIEPGKRADLLLLDKELNVSDVVLAGQVVSNVSEASHERAR